MNIKPIRILLVVLIAFLSVQSQARTLFQPPEYIAKEGAWVKNPAHVGGVIGAGVGAIVGAPFMLLSVPIGYASGDPWGKGGIPVSVGAWGGAELGYHVAATPTYIAKKVLWDTPAYVTGYVRDDAPDSGLIADVDAANQPGVDWHAIQQGSATSARSTVHDSDQALAQWRAQVQGVAGSSTDTLPASDPESAQHLPSLNQDASSTLANWRDSVATDTSAVLGSSSAKRRLTGPRPDLRNGRSRVVKSRSPERKWVSLSEALAVQNGEKPNLRH